MQMGVHKKKSSAAAKKKPLTDFGPALAKARQDTDHIFKQASAAEITNNPSTNSNSSSSKISSPTHNNIAAATDYDLKPDPRSKAAAWAWYQRGGNMTGVANNPEEVRNRALVVVKRSSRFKAEALRVNGSYTADDTIIKAEQKWDPNQSLFDSFELLCVAKELDRALKEQHEHQQLKQEEVPISGVSGSDSSSRRRIRRESSKNLVSSLSCSSPSLMRKEGLASKFSRWIPTPVLCLSEDDIATKSSSFRTKSDLSSSNIDKKIMMRRGTSLGSATLGRISKLLRSNLSTNLPQQVDDDDEHHHQHEHFHHHHHHHHHHVS